MEYGAYGVERALCPCASAIITCLWLVGVLVDFVFFQFGHFVLV